MVPGVKIFKRHRDALGYDKTAIADTADELAGTQPEVLADYKVADIGFNREGEWQGTNEKLVRTLANAGAGYITVHTFPGLSSIDEAVQTAHTYGARVLTLPFMTHKGAELFFGMPLGAPQRQHLSDVMQGYGISSSDATKLAFTAKTITEAILNIADHFGTDGFIGPGNNLEVLKTYRRLTEREIWSPAFGRQNKLGTLEEQIEAWVRIVGPNSALIVGSLIYNDDDPAEAAREVMETRDRVVERHAA